MAESNMVFLSSSGSFIDKVGLQHDMGMVCTIWNYPMRGQLWRMHQVSADVKNKRFAIADERGQVYCFDVKENVYSLVRMASVSISAIQFVPGSNSQLIVAYESGVVLIIDTLTKGILANISMQSGTVVRLIRCHPTKMVVLLGLDDGSIAMWDIKTMRCIRTLDSVGGAILNISYENNGDLMAITVVHSKRQAVVYFYQTKDDSCSPVAQCRLPPSERFPSKWTAYCSCDTTPRRESNGKSAKSSECDYSSVIFVAGDNGLIYIWSLQCAIVSDNADARPHVGNSSMTCTTTFIGLAELPVKMKMAVEMTVCDSTSHITCPRLSILSQEGDVIVVDVEEVASNRPGYVAGGYPGSWIVVAECPAEYLGMVKPSNPNLMQSVSHGTIGSSCHLNPFSFGGYKNPTAVPEEEELFQHVLPFSGPMGMANLDDNLLVVGLDGAIRMVDVSQLLLTPVTGILVGATLRSRGSRGNEDVQFKTTTSTNPVKRSPRSTNSHSRGRSKRSTAPHAMDDKHKAEPTVEKKAVSGEPQQTQTMSVSATLASTPLFELNGLSPKDRRISEKKLSVFLNKTGEYPEKYRPIIWRFLLKLPENSSCFTDLVKRGTYPTYEQLYLKYPLQSGRLFDRLQSICSQLAHWSPIFGEVSYTPVIAFPFLLVFERDDLAVLETVMTVFMWWGFTWQVTFPHPPVHIVNAIDSIMKFHDLKLYDQLSEMGASVGLLGWTMISTIFTEVLSKQDWLRLMDHLFTDVSKPHMILLAPVALMRATKIAVVSCVSEAAVNTFYRRQQTVDLSQVVLLMKTMEETTSSKHLTAVSGISGNDIAGKNATSTGVHGALEVMAKSEGSPVFPLPNGGYPAYHAYPNKVVDWQLSNREKALELQNETEDRKSVLRQLELKIAQVEIEHQRWVTKQKMTTQTEMEQKAVMMQKEKEHMNELLRIEEAISAQRIASLSTIEKAAKEEMEIMDTVALDAQKLLSESERHLSDKIDVALKLQKHRELSLSAEQSSSDKLRRLYMVRTREDWIRNLQSSVGQKEDELAARDAILAEQWKYQDEERKQQLEMRTEQARAHLAEERNAELQGDLSQRLQRLQLARQTKIMEIERTRALRLAKEQADEAAESASNSVLLLQKQEALSADEENAIFAESNLKESQQRLMKTVDLIEEESVRLLEFEKVHVHKEQKSRHKSRVAQLRKEWAEKQGKQLQVAVEAERIAQEQLLRMRKASARIETDPSASVAAVKRAAGLGPEGDSDEMSEGHFYDRAERHLKDLADKLLDEQRAKFHELSDETGGAGVRNTTSRASQQSTIAATANSISEEFDLDGAQWSHQSNHATHPSPSKSISSSRLSPPPPPPANREHLEKRSARDDIKAKNGAKSSLLHIANASLRTLQQTRNDMQQDYRDSNSVSSSAERHRQGSPRSDDDSLMSTTKTTAFKAGDSALWAFNDSEDGSSRGSY